MTTEQSTPEGMHAMQGTTACLIIGGDGSMTLRTSGVSQDFIAAPNKPMSVVTRDLIEQFLLIATGLLLSTRAKPEKAKRAPSEGRTSKAATSESAGRPKTEGKSAPKGRRAA